MYINNHGHGMRNTMCKQSRHPRLEIFSNCFRNVMSTADLLLVSKFWI